MRHIALYVLGFVVLFWTNTPPASATETDWEFVDIDGKVHRPFDDASIRGIAIVFISTDCPIANSYLPLLGRLADEYSGAGIRIFIVHPYPEVSVADARRHAREFKIDSPVVIDNDQRISKTVGATVTPEVFVFVRQQKQPVYRGRIDNRYAGYGKKRRVATTHELADALDAVIAGQTPAESITEAIGCHISFVD